MSDFDEIRTEEPEFQITIRLLTPVPARVREAFEAGARRWSRLIRPTLPSVIVEKERIDGLLVIAQVLSMGDGPGGHYAQAGPTILRPRASGAPRRSDLLPAKGTLVVDGADVNGLLRVGMLSNVIAHELGHVLGFGSQVWQHKGLLGGNTRNPVFRGEVAMREYAVLTQRVAPIPVPVANEGAVGIRECHWRERIFGPELMSSVVDRGVPCPISRVTIASLHDIGYDVMPDFADPYELPSARDLFEVGADIPANAIPDRPVFLPTVPMVLPESAAS